MTLITCTLCKYHHTILIISRPILLRVRYVADKICRGNQNTHFVFSNFFNVKSCRLWDNVETCGRAGQVTDDNMAHANWMLDTEGYKPTLRICNTIGFPLQQWVHESTSILRYTYIVCLVTTTNSPHFLQYTDSRAEHKLQKNFSPENVLHHHLN
jgi:hypothetical protein